MNIILDFPYKISLIKLSKKYNFRIYITGGTVRDILLKNQKINDIDIAVEGCSETFSRNFSNIINASFVILDRKRKIYRVVKNKFFFDFTQISGTIIDDCKRRDFTINSIAFDLKENKIIDPFNGISDLNNKIIRMNSQTSFCDDPLRIIRAFRFSLNLFFKIDNKTSKLISKYSDSLNNVAGERINNELSLILEHPSCLKTLESMNELRILKHIFYRKIKKDNFRFISRYEFFLKHQKNKSINKWLNENIKGGKSRNAFIKFILLIIDLSPYHIKIVLKRLKLSSEEKKILMSIVKIFSSMDFLIDENDFYQVLHSFKAQTPFIIILLYICRFISKNKYQRLLLDFFKYLKIENNFSKIISGNKILDKLKSVSGPEIGIIVQNIKKELFTNPKEAKIKLKQESYSNFLISDNNLKKNSNFIKGSY